MQKPSRKERSYAEYLEPHEHYFIRIHAHHGTSLSEIARLLGTSKSTVNMAIRRLKSDGRWDAMKVRANVKD